ncbi:MAG TPA: fibronectin type III domain-containing protein [Solirubrobacterales bacterium]|jgi:hypothetical protein
MRRAIVTFALAWAFSGSAGAAGATTNAVPLPLCCVPNGQVEALAVDGETAYVGGSFTHLGLLRHHLAVLDPASGEPQEGWPGVDGGFVRASVPDGAGGWYLAGDFTSVGGVPRDGLAHLLADKSVDPGWAPSTDGTVRAIARDSNGVVYVGGSFTEVDGNTPRANFAALGAGGRPTAFTADADGPVDAIATSFRLAGSPGSSTSIARLYLGGEFTHLGGVARHFFAALDPGTGALVGADPELNGKVTTIAVGGGGAFAPRFAYVGGAFTGMPSLTRVHAAAFRDDTAGPTEWGPFVDPAPEAIAVSGPNVYLGNVETVNGTARQGIAAVDAETGTSLRPWTPVIEAPTGFRRVRSMAVLGGALYVAGTFTGVDGTPRSNLAAIDATSGATLAWDPAPPGFTAGVTTLGFDGVSMLVSGEFNEIGGPARSNLAAVDLGTGQVTPFDPQMDGEVDALALRGSTLYVGGKFAHVGGVARTGAAAVGIGTGTPTPFDPQIAANPEVRSLALGDRTVFLGGPFIQVGGQPRVGLAEVDAQTGAVTPFRDDPDGAVSALAYDDGSLYVGGAFQHIGGVARGRLAAILPALGGQVTPFDPNFDGPVSALLVRDGDLYVSGDFHHLLNAVPRAFLSAFDLANLTLLPLAPQVDAGPTSLADDDSDLFAAGGLTSVSGSPRPGVGAIDFASGLGTPWSPSLASGFKADVVAVSRDGGAIVGANLISSGRGLLEAFAIAPSTPGTPQATASGAGQATVTVAPPPDGGSPITSYTVTANPGGATATASASPIVIDGLTPGTYTFTVAAANAAGQSLTSAPSSPVTITVPSPNPTNPSTRSNNPKLRASHFRVTHRRFMVVPAKVTRTPRTAHALPQSTTFTFNLSAPAVSRITIARTLPGVKRGKHCVAPRPKLHHRCTRLNPVGTLTHAGHDGHNKIPFTGRLNGGPLHPGSYRATLTATDRTGDRSASLALTFVVVHP